MESERKILKQIYRGALLSFAATVGFGAAVALRETNINIPQLSASPGSSYNRVRVRDYFDEGIDLGPEIRLTYPRPEATDEKTDLEKLRDKFKNKIDRDGDGQISMEEIKRAVREMGFEPPKIDDRYQILVDPYHDGITIKGCPPGAALLIPKKSIEIYVEDLE